MTYPSFAQGIKDPLSTVLDQKSALDLGGGDTNAILATINSYLDAQTMKLQQ